MFVASVPSVVTLTNLLPPVPISVSIPRILKLGTLETSRAPAQFQALVQGTRAQVLFDTGADENFVSENFASAKGLIVTKAI